MTLDLSKLGVARRRRAIKALERAVSTLREIEADGDLDPDWQADLHVLEAWLAKERTK